MLGHLETKFTLDVTECDLFDTVKVGKVMDEWIDIFQ